MRVVVAMSGGVDSSVVAGLLHEAGHEVIGVTLQLYDHGAGDRAQGRVLRRAGHPRRAARRRSSWHPALRHRRRGSGLPHAVIGDFADSYAAGETPVPCVRCNQTVKFADLSGAGARTGRGAAGDRALCAPDRWAARARTAPRRGPGARPELVPVRDHARRSLAFVLFPLGEMPDKAAVRAEAARLGLPVAAKPDSQDICFVPSGHYADAGGAAAAGCAEAGRDRRAATGVCVGRHDGIARYTVGQGKRLGAAGAGSRRAAGGRGARSGAGGAWWSGRAGRAPRIVIGCAR